MKLLNLEVTSHGELFHSRYEIFRENGAEVYYLTASQNSVLWPGFAGVRVLTDQIIDTLIAAARAWREEIRFDAILTTDEASVIATAAASEALSCRGSHLPAPVNAVTNMRCASLINSIRRRIRRSGCAKPSTERCRLAHVPFYPNGHIESQVHYL